MTNRSPFPLQIRLPLPCESPVVLEGATREEIVQLLAQLLAGVVHASSTADPEVRDETR
jgi:hypothetical protein